MCAPLASHSSHIITERRRDRLALRKRGRSRISAGRASLAAAACPPRRSGGRASPASCRPVEPTAASASAPWPRPRRHRPRRRLACLLAWGSGKRSGSKKLCARLSGGSASRCAYHSCHGGHDCGCEGLAHVHPTSLDSTLLACVLEPALGSVHMPGAGLVPTPKAENAHMHPCSPQVELQPPAPLGLQRGTRPFSAARHVLEHEICDDLVY